jgi:hypothetical protein
MPNLGAGVDQHINTTPVPTWVFTPNPVGGATVRLYNEGTQPVYVGGADVSPFNGLPLFPGGRPLELQNITGTVYTCSNAVVGSNTASATISSNGATAGSTVLTVGSAFSTTITAGTTMILSGPAGVGAEVITVSGTAASALTLSTALLYDHRTASTATVATSTPGQLRVTAGVA